jgi:hypothetical protein
MPSPVFKRRDSDEVNVTRSGKRYSVPSMWAFRRQDLRIKNVL